MRVTATAVLLFALSVSALAFGQQEKPTWKEYTYPADGFALTVPTAPKPHHSPVLPGATAYAVPLDNAGVVLRVKATPDCSSVISRMREGLLGGEGFDCGRLISQKPSP